MKTFLDLLATNFSIDIEMTIVPGLPGVVEVWINGKQIYNHAMQQTTKLKYQIPILQPVEIQVLHSGAYVESLKFDGWESRPEYGQELPGCWQLKTDVPFYQWKHHATGQGWLLQPN
jgi:hypothetical protein